MKYLSAALFTLLTAACGSSGSNNNDAGGVRGAYPAAPYGLIEGATIEPLSFLRPDGTMLSTETVWADNTRKMLLVITSSGWCTACIEEQPDLQRFHETFGARGLTIIEALFEDASFQPATKELADQWKRQYDVAFDVVADPSFLLGRYYNRELTPMNLIIDVSKMEILRISTGADPNALEAIFSARL